MSYSFSVREPNKAAAKSAIAKQLAQVVAAQSVHTADAQQAQAAANAYIDVLPDDETKHVDVRMSGYLSWDSQAPNPIKVANVTITAALVE